MTKKRSLAVDGDIEERRTRGDFAPLATQASLDLDEAITRSLIEAGEDDDDPEDAQ